MPCKRWNEQWVARLYDELEPEEERRLSEHLESCAECRRTLEDLERSRRLLHVGAPPVPATPRVMVLRSPRLARPAWAFASALAAAVLVFASGLFLGYRLPARGASPPPALSDVARPADLEAQRRELGARLDDLERQLTTLSSQPRTRPQADAAMQASLVTREALDDRLEGMRQELRAERARDVEFLLGEITATEWRAGNWVDETREAMRNYVALLDPRISER